MNKITPIIKHHILLIRNQKVLLDNDLALLYGIETRSLIQAVKRNIDRFPADFMFQLTDQELSNLRSQFVISSWGGRRRPPYAFTEQGVAMLSSVLKSQQAIDVNIEIMRTFVQIRQMLSSNKELKQKLNALEQKYDGQFKAIFEAMHQLMAPTEIKKKKAIGFKEWVD